MNDPETQFEYQGRLVFNGIYRTKKLNSGFEIGDILNRLPAYKQGSPANPGQGYSDLELTSFAHDTDELETELIHLAEETLSIQHHQEEYHEEEFVDIDGDSETAYTRSINSVDIFWIFPDYLFLRGSKNNVVRVQQEISAALKEWARIDQIDFDPDFLIWMIYKYYTHENVERGFGINRLTDAKIRGSTDFSGRTRRISDSIDLIQSTPVLTAILKGDDIMTIGGDFSINRSYNISADIATSGRVHIKAQSGDIQNANSLRRILISLLFLKRITKVYSTWEELAPTEKYPPDNFFENLYQELEELGISVTFPLKNVLQEYAAKRGEQ